MKWRILIFSIILSLSGGNLFGQYYLPMDNFSRSDSISIDNDLRKYAEHVGVHFGHIPGTVFQLNREYPRIQFFYQHDMAWTAIGSRYWKEDGTNFSTVGTFTGIGELTPNLQIILRYNPMVIDGESAVFNGFGVRYRSGVGTDSLHSLAVGIMVQKLDGSQVIKTNDLDISLHYSHFVSNWTITYDIALSAVSGTMDILPEKDFGSDFNGEFERQLIHLGAAIQRSWHGFHGGLGIRTNGSIWSITAELGWSIPSSQ